MFIRRHGASVIILAVYVDDLIAVGSNLDDINSMINALSSRFDARNLGNLHFFLGIPTYRSTKDVFLNHMKYSMDILSGFNINDCKPVSTASVGGVKLSRSDGELLRDVTEYKSIVVSLQYLTMTRHDLAYALNYVCQFIPAPCTAHFSAVERILLYIKGIHAFSDAGWAGGIDVWLSISGSAITLRPNLIIGLP